VHCTWGLPIPPAPWPRRDDRRTVGQHAFAGDQPAHDLAGQWQAARALIGGLGADHPQWFRRCGGGFHPPYALQGISRIYIPHQPKRLRLSLHPSWIGLECPGKIGRIRHIKVLKLDLIHKNIDNAGTPPMALGLGVDFPNLGRLNLNHCPHHGRV